MNTTALFPRGLRPVRAGVAGWLLLLCVFLVAVGPAISAWLFLDRQAVVGPRVMGSILLQALFAASQLLSLAATAWGIVAGWRLWQVRPGAVASARLALLAALAVDVLCATFDIATHPLLVAQGGLIRQVLWAVVPDLICFTACLGYLHHSRRVRATYPHEDTTPC